MKKVIHSSLLVVSVLSFFASGALASESKATATGEKRNTECRTISDERSSKDADFDRQDDGEVKKPSTVKTAK